MTKIPNTTLVCVDCVNPKKALRTLDFQKRHFNKVIFFSDFSHDNYDEVSAVKIDKIKSLNEYNYFILKELHKYIDTKFVIICQTDGFILNPNQWNDSFYNYDFIGAPLPDYSTWLEKQPSEFQIRWKENNFNELKWPQNGGFSFRSKRLLELSAECPFDIGNIAEDNYINIYFRDWFEKKNIKFAPKSLAYQFSVENPLKHFEYTFDKSFGFHGRQTPKHIDLISVLETKKNRLKILKKVLNLNTKYSLKQQSILIIKKAFKKLSRDDFFLLYRDFRYNQNLKPDKNLILDVAICCIDKDVKTLPHCIESLRNFVAHKIDNIYLIAPINSVEIRKIAKSKKCVFIDESKVIDIKKNEIKYAVKGLDRSGWIFQQLLKLHVDLISKRKNTFIIDADTILTRPKSLIHKGKTILNFSDEYHLPYQETLNRLLKNKTTMSVSFVSHMMVIENKKLKQLRAKIEATTNKTFIESILDNLDPNEVSCFSEYELYANYILNNSRKIQLQYWGNKSYKREKIELLDQLKKKAYISEINSISFHKHY